MEIKESLKDSLQESFLTERYKYILSRKNDLNEKTFKIVSLYQIIIFGFVLGFYTIYSNKSLSGVAEYFCNGLIVILILTTSLLILLLIGGILAWLDIRNEESELMNSIFKKTRDKIRLKDLFRWYESYIILCFVVITSSIVIGYFKFLDNLF